MVIKKDPSRKFKLTISFVITLLLAIGVKAKFGYINFIDSAITGVVQRVQSGFTIHFYTFISFLASPKMDIIWMILIAFLLWGYRYKIPAFFALGLIISGDAVAFVLKHIIARPRPTLHLLKDTGYSFPSGHVLGTFFIVSVLWIIAVPMLDSENKKIILRIILSVWLLLVMLSRVYLNAHFPSDVVAAAFLAYTWLQVCEYLYVKYAAKLTQKRIFIHSLY